MAAPNVVHVLLLTTVTATIVGIMNVSTTGASWCVAKSDANETALQSALDWACGHGADCGPIQPDAPCFNPNTVKDHASYAFDSYYKRNNKGPGSCDFSGTANTTETDPSMIIDI